MDRQVDKQVGYRYSINILEDFYCAGLTLEVDEGMIRVTPKSFVTDEVRRLVREYKPKLLRLLTAEMTKGVACRVCGWKGDGWGGYCEWCIDFQVEAEAVGCELILFSA